MQLNFDLKALHTMHMRNHEVGFIPVLNACKRIFKHHKSTNERYQKNLLFTIDSVLSIISNIFTCS
uniref:Putative ovule protein n=1 Tax=Solanum chacoense TaxID=4108 RepID=A0A0V0HHR5_SOLCH